MGGDAGVAGKAIRDSGIRQNYDVIVIAIKKPDGRMVFNPGPEVVLARDDVLIALGDRDQMGRLRTALA